MTQAQFLNLISTYGRSPQRWPEDIRSDALCFMEENMAVLESELAEVEALDQALDRATIMPPSDMLRQRILNALPPQTEYVPVRQGGFGYKSVAAMAMIAFGLGFGGAQFVSLAPQNNQDQMSATVDDINEADWSEAANELGLSDIYNWVEGEDTLIITSGT